MSNTIPENPASREEQYLNFMATGSGDLPDYVGSRKEQYLKYICENGLKPQGGWTKADLATAVQELLLDDEITASDAGKAMLVNAEGEWALSTVSGGVMPEGGWTKANFNPNVFNDIAEVYDSTETYTVGELVMYSKNLYKCTTAVETAEEFDATKWTQTTIDEVLQTFSPVSATAWGEITGTLSNQTDLNTALSGKASASDVTSLSSDVDAIEGKIPSQATSTNQLADKDFVNSSIGTNTANYISNGGQPFTSVAQLEAYTGTVTNNDYAFVTGTDAQGNSYYDRYKATVSGSTVTWALEYRLNNSSFTAAQWASISSGITASNAAFINACSHETWTITLDDNTVVTKEMVKWTQPV